MAPPASFAFEGREVPFEDGDTIASALYRDGLRTFNRSLKHHRRRGLTCLTGDCPNCLLTVDGEPGVRSCVTDAREGQTVRRETGWPGAERDALAVTDHLHRAMPVGFYYKTFTRPRFAWETAEKIIRRATGVGSLPRDGVVTPKPSRFVPADVLVVGGGVAGLSAARAAAEVGDVLVVDEGEVGGTIAPGPAKEAVERLVAEVRALANVEILERHTAIGVYAGPSVPVVGPKELLQVEPGRVVVATGALEAHGVFPGNDLPGVWLGRGAARMAGVHGVPIGEHAVVWAQTDEGLTHAATMLATGVDVTLLVPPDLAGRAPDGARALQGARVAAATGSKLVRAVSIDGPEGPATLACDALVLSLGWAPRDGLLRMANGDPVLGAGDVVAPGRSLEETIESGRRAGAGEANAAVEQEAPGMSGGYVCLCEDVGIRDLETAWEEGWTSSEILKRYTTATMGPCQGAVCGRSVARFAEEHTDAPATKGARTTARPPVRSVKLEDLAGAVHEVIDHRTSLHERHLEAKARMDRSGVWLRPATYGDVEAEYRAVRERVGIMDVGTLGKFLIAGREASKLLDLVLPIRLDDLVPGRSRYFVALDEGGYVMDDGLVCALDGGRYFVTSTSGGAAGMEAWLRDRVDRFDLHVHLVDQTAQLGAINVAGPGARDLLAELTDDDLSRAAIPYPGHAEVTVAGVPCRALTSGFVGELAFELHHPRSRGVELWEALVDVGRAWDLRPHGLDALDLLRLEKGHLYLGQDTLPDDHPGKLGLDRMIAMDKPWFVGKRGLERMASHPLERKLVGLRFDVVPPRGAPLRAGRTVAGRITSCAESPALGHAIGLGWIRAVDGAFPTVLEADDVTATVVPTPFYDPEGARLRA